MRAHPTFPSPLNIISIVLIKTKPIAEHKIHHQPMLGLRIYHINHRHPAHGGIHSIYYPLTPLDQIMPRVHNAFDLLFPGGFVPKAENVLRIARRTV